MGEGTGIYRVLVKRLEREKPLGRPRSRREDNIKCTLERYRSMGRTAFDWLRIGSGGGFCEQGDETSGSIKKAGYCVTS
jgi:hypothetical protein